MRIMEVGPRDGLQDVPQFIPTAVKIAFIEALARSGVQEIEVTAFVSPQWVPQMADAVAVCAGLRRQPGVVYAALVPNEIGMERAEQVPLDKICVLTAASESFNQKNVNTSLAGTLTRMAPVIRRAHAAHLQVRGYISTAFWCPYEGAVPTPRTLYVMQRLLEMGVDEIALGDTIGKATPDEVTALLEVLCQHIATTQLALHFHDTFGRATANVHAAANAGIVTFDASVGGLGGCPYAPGAPGNLATEALLQLLQQRGEPAPVDAAQLTQARALLQPYLAARP